HPAGPGIIQVPMVQRGMPHLDQHAVGVGSRLGDISEAYRLRHRRIHHKCTYPNNPSSRIMIGNRGYSPVRPPAFTSLSVSEDDRQVSGDLLTWSARYGLVVAVAHHQPTPVLAGLVGEPLLSAAPSRRNRRPGREGHPVGMVAPAGGPLGRRIAGW